MSLSKGVSRINALIRWCAYLLLGAGFLCLLMAWADSREPGYWLLVATIAAVVGGAMYAISWVVAGFLDDEAPQTGRRFSEGHVTAIRWAIVLGGMVAGSLIVYREDGDVARYVGYVLMLLLIVSAIAYAARRGRPPGIIGAAIFAILAIGHAVKTHIEAAQKRESALAAITSMRTAQEARISGAPVLPAVASPASSTPNDPFARLAAFMKSTAAEASANEQRYIQATQRAQPELWVANDALLNKSIRDRHRPKIAELAKARDGYERQTLDLLQRTRQFAEASIKEGGDAASIGEGALKTLPKNEALARQFLATEREFVVQVIGLYDFLDNPALPHTVTADQILFQREADLKQYRGFFAEIQRISSRSEQITAEIQEMHRAGQEKMRAAEAFLSQPVGGRRPP
jgi:hypothetical protein